MLKALVSEPGTAVSGTRNSFVPADTGGSASGFSEPGTGDKGENAMSRKTKYTNEKLQMGERVVDFFAAPIKTGEK